MLKHIGINLTNVLLIKADKITQIQTEIVYLAFSITKIFVYEGVGVQNPNYSCFRGVYRPETGRNGK